MVPVEVKSAHNVQARTLSMFMEKVVPPYAVIFSENDFSKGMAASGTEVRRLPLYAAHCVGQGCMKAGF